MHETTDFRRGEEEVELRSCVLIPTHNHEATVTTVVGAALRLGTAVFVVDDGSKDGTCSLLKSLEGVNLVVHPKTLGKGAALWAGLRAAQEAGYTQVVTLDPGGLFEPGVVQRFLDESRRRPGELTLANRELTQVGWRLRWRRSSSSSWIWAQTGLRLPDASAGLRCYPLEEVLARYIRSKGRLFEAEVIVKAAWAGVPIGSIEVPAEQFKIEGWGTGRSSLRDHILDFELRARLVVARLCLPPQFLELISRRSFQGLPRASRLKESFQELFVREPGSSARIGVSAGVGFFIGLSPAWGYQILLTLVACHRLRLSKTVALLAAHISLPPFIPFIIYTSLVIGRLLLGQDAGRAPTSLELEAHDLPAWILGSLSLGATVGVVGGLLVYLLVLSARRLKGSAAT